MMLLCNIWLSIYEKWNRDAWGRIHSWTFACFSKNAAVPLIDVSPPSGDVRAQVGSGRRRDWRAVVLDRFANDGSVLMNGSIGHSSVFRRKRICPKRRRVARCDGCWRTDGRQSTRLESDPGSVWSDDFQRRLMVMRPPVVWTFNCNALALPKLSYVEKFLLLRHWPFVLDQIFV